MVDKYRKDREDAIIRSLGWQKAYDRGRERPARPPANVYATRTASPVASSPENGAHGGGADWSDARVERRVRYAVPGSDGERAARAASSASSTDGPANSGSIWDDPDCPADRWADDGGTPEGGDF